MRVTKAVSAVLVLLTLTATQAVGQEPVPVVEDAELIFDQGLEAFEEGDYGMGFRRFRMVYDTYPLNRKTTAALLMAGKALYRSGEYDQAIRVLETLLENYSTSGYLDEARRVIGFSRERRQLQEDGNRVTNLGIVLPLQGADASLTQALFTGVRLAIEEHNEINSGPVRMIFRDTRGNADRAAEAVSELAGLGVQAVIGPLYSGEAQSAARAAEAARVVLMPPLANDESVSEGREFVFQANPTIATHGKLMARFAIRSLMMNEFGIVAERDRDAISERMAEGFQEEAVLQGTDVYFYDLLEARSDWSRLNERIGADTLRSVDAVYFPMAGGETNMRIDAAFTSLDRASATRTRVLGNSEWHEMPNPNRASQYGTTYTTDFNVDESDGTVQAFSRRFQEITGRAPDPSSTTGRLAFTGFDVTRFLLAQLVSNTSIPLRQRLRNAPAYQGLGIRIDFRSGNVNEALYYLRYQDGNARLLR